MRNISGKFSDFDFSNTYHQVKTDLGPPPQSHLPCVFITL